MMHELLGDPPEKMLAKAKRKSYFTDDKGKMIPYKTKKGTYRVPGGKPLTKAIKTDDKLFLDFLNKCLTWDPDDRMTAVEALNH